MTLDEILAVVRDDPKLFWALKEEMLNEGKIAGPWMEFNKSAESRRQNTQNSSWVRFTPIGPDPDRMESGVVARVREKGWISTPDPYDYDDTSDEAVEAYETDLAQANEKEARKETHPWYWLGHGASVDGDGVTKEDAMARADRALRQAGWVFVMSDLELLAKEA
jgi:hypothetical protein